MILYRRIGILEKSFCNFYKGIDKYLLLWQLRANIQIPRGEGGWDELRDWDWHIYTTMHETGNKRERTVQHPDCTLLPVIQVTPGFHSPLLKHYFAQIQSLYPVTICLQFISGILFLSLTPIIPGSSQPRNRTRVSHIAGRSFYHLSHQGSLFGFFCYFPLFTLFNPLIKKYLLSMDSVLL